MKTAIAVNDKLIELFHIDETNTDKRYCPEVIRIVNYDDKEGAEIAHLEYNITTDYGRKVFIVPENLWQEVIEYKKDIEEFIMESMEVAPRLVISKHHIWNCDDGFMYTGPVEQKGLNWISFFSIKNRNIIVVGHSSNPQKNEFEKGLLEGNIIPISEEFCEFIIKDVYRRIKYIKGMILSLYNPY